MVHIVDRQKYNLLESLTKTGKYYRASSGLMKYLICRATNKKIVTAPTEEQFLQDVDKFFR